VKNILIVIAVILITGCSLEKRETGGAWEVVVVTSNDSLGQVAKDSLGIADTLLPQPEPWFDVTVLKQMDAVAKRHRNLVDLTKNDAPNWTQLRKELITKERQRAKEYLEKHHNKTTSEMVKKLFGIEMIVPEEMKKSKQGKDFLWLSNGTATGMTNLCIYTLPKGCITDEKTFRTMRDSVMESNIPGEHDGVYMSTYSVHETNGTPKTFRGLWAMKDDMMGGPYCAVVEETKDKTIVKEVFVYAPEGKKRNIMRRIEGAIF
jgi:hypothetical protein